MAPKRPMTIEDFGKPEELNLATVLFQAMGYASVCWSETPQGIFESDAAKEAGDLVLAWINERYIERAQVLEVLVDPSEPTPLGDAVMGGIVDEGVTPVAPIKVESVRVDLEAEPSVPEPVARGTQAARRVVKDDTVVTGERPAVPPHRARQRYSKPSQ